MIRDVRVVRSRCLVALLVRAALFLLAAPFVFGLGTASSASGLEGQAQPSVPVQECVPGVTVPTGAPRNGPSPVGQCEPSERQQLMDTAVWLYLVGLLGLLVVIGVTALARSLGSGDEARPDQRADYP